jgi:DNA ligase (NAD+)
MSYNGGRLERCLSRGDGIMGQDITRNVLKTTATNKSFPTEITEPVYIVYKNGDESGKDKIVKLKNFEVRGELLMTKQHFENINRQRQTQNGRQFKNGRNLVAGMMRLDLGDDSSPSSISSIDVIGRIELSLVSYMLLVDKSKQETVSEVPKGSQSVVVQGSAPSHYQSLEILRKIGFTPDKHSTLANSIDGVFKFINTWETQRDSYDYLLDGVVIKLNSAEQQVSRLSFEK